MTEGREGAWAALHDALASLPGWAVGPCQHHAESGLWHVTAVDLRPRGRQARREAIEAAGATESRPSTSCGCCSPLGRPRPTA